MYHVECGAERGIFYRGSCLSIGDAPAVKHNKLLRVKRGQRDSMPVVWTTSSLSLARLCHLHVPELHVIKQGYTAVAYGYD